VERLPKEFGAKKEVPISAAPRKRITAARPCELGEMEDGRAALEEFRTVVIRIRAYVASDSVKT
jgi:hypothetical protein